mmetsp:Transcript_20791/g.47810  ORF Transcript_20791/g.47810 Transcript_20791/m.47810 type:complete len:93 (+) Transcript_20791:407-685(+)
MTPTAKLMAKTAEDGRTEGRASAPSGVACSTAARPCVNPGWSRAPVPGWTNTKGDTHINPRHKAAATASARPIFFCARTTRRLYLRHDYAAA